MKARDVMTPDVITVKPDEQVMHAVRLMLQKRISKLPVLDGSGTLVGIVTEGDLLRRSELGTQRRRPRWIEFFVGPGKLAEEYVHSSGRKVEEVMTTTVHTIAEDTSLEEIVQLMERNRVKRMPVERSGKLVEIVTRANLMRALASVSHEIAPASSDDNAIRERVVAELKSQSWAPVAMVDVIVRKGVVTLSGVLTDPRQREALKVAAENVPGVTKVVDHLVWVEPLSGAYVEAPGQ